MLINEYVCLDFWKMSGNEQPDQPTTRKGRKPRRKNQLSNDGVRKATLMKRVHQVRKKGERIQVSFDDRGQPMGKEGDELMSWVGVLAQEYIPI